MRYKDCLSCQLLRSSDCIVLQACKYGQHLLITLSAGGKGQFQHLVWAETLWKHVPMLSRTNQVCQARADVCARLEWLDTRKLPWSRGYSCAVLATWPWDLHSTGAPSQANDWCVSLHYHWLCMIATTKQKCYFSCWRSCILNSWIAVVNFAKRKLVILIHNMSAVNLSTDHTCLMQHQMICRETDMGCSRVINNPAATFGEYESMLTSCPEHKDTLSIKRFPT